VLDGALDFLHVVVATAFAATALTIRACGTLASHQYLVPFEQAKKIAVLESGSVMFARRRNRRAPAHRLA
jgi:hypothetical protein